MISLLTTVIISRFQTIMYFQANNFIKNKKQILKKCRKLWLFDINEAVKSIFPVKLLFFDIKLPAAIFCFIDLIRI